MLRGTMILATVMLVLCRSALAGGIPVSQGCGVMSLFALCAWVGRPVSQANAELVGKDPAGTCATMADMVHVGNVLGVSLEGYRSSFQELVQLGRPAIIHLCRPEHFAVFLGATADVVQLVDGGLVVVTGRSAIEARFTGEILLAKPASDPGARIEVAERDYFVPAGDARGPLEHTFSYSNAGVSPLEVRIVENSCACNVVRLEGGPVAPGRRGTVTIRTQGGRGETVARVILGTNDPSCPRVLLSLRAKLPWGVTVTPPAVTWFADRGREVERTVRITADAGVGVVRAEVDSPGVRVVRVEREGSAGGSPAEWKVVLSCGDSVGVGTFDHTLTLHTTDLRHSTIAVPIHGRIEGDLACAPSEVFLGFIRPGKESAQTISVRSRVGKTFQVQNVTSSSKEIRASWVASHSVLRIQVRPTRPGAIEGWVELATDVPGQEKIRVPVSGFVE